MSKNKLAPSILNADFSCLKDILLLLEKCNVDSIHLDVMDGNFVPNISFGPKMVETIRNNCKLPLSVHLMIEKPERYIHEFSKILFQQDSLIIHAEACLHLDRTLQMIIDSGLKAGVALNPSTPLEMIRLVLYKVDVILLMTVNPGFGGQKFISSMYEKISETRKIIDQYNSKKIDIQVDGGINRQNIQLISKAGANIIVVGSEIFESENPEKTIIEIKKKLCII